MTRCSSSANGYIYLVSSLVIIFGAVMRGSIDCLIFYKSTADGKYWGGSANSNVLCSVKICGGAVTLEDGYQSFPCFQLV